MKNDDISTKNSSNKLNFTVANVEAIPFTTDGKQVTYYDEKSKLALRVGAKRKTWIVQKRLPDTAFPVRVKIGEFPDLPPLPARKLAEKKLGELATGHNPVVVKQQKKDAEAAKTVYDKETVSWMLDRYKTEWLMREGKGKQASLDSHEDAVKFFDERVITLLVKDDKGRWKIDENAGGGTGQITLSSWLERPYQSITRTEVLERFRYFARSMKSRGKKLEPMVRTYQIGFKTLQAAFNHVIRRSDPECRDNIPNPVLVITDYKLWTKTNVVEDKIDFDDPECAVWWNALMQYKTKNLVGSYYILFSLLQGGRSIEIYDLEFKSIDMSKREITYKDTKNGQTYVMYVSNLAMKILEELKPLSLNGKVFYYRDTKDEVVSQQAKPYFANIAKRGGKLISHHDLKRSWTAAAQHCGIDKTTIDYCLKHKVQGVDANYFSRNKRLVIEALQKVEDFMISQVAKFNSLAKPSVEEQVEQNV